MQHVVNCVGGRRDLRSFDKCHNKAGAIYTRVWQITREMTDGIALVHKRTALSVTGL